MKGIKLIVFFAFAMAVMCLTGCTENYKYFDKDGNEVSSDCVPTEGYVTMYVNNETISWDGISSAVELPEGLSNSTRVTVTEGSYAKFQIKDNTDCYVESKDIEVLGFVLPDEKQYGGVYLKIGFKDLLKCADYYININQISIDVWASEDTKEPKTISMNGADAGDGYFSTPAYGSCGDNATYNVTRFEDNSDKKILTISGSGEIYDLRDEEAPWEMSKSKIYEVYIGDDITSIGKYAFADLTNADRWVLAKNLSKIGDNSFNGCSKMSVINIPASVTSIGANAFAGCTSLKRICFNSEEMPEIASDAFDGLDITVICPSSWGTVTEKFGANSITWVNEACDHMQDGASCFVNEICSKCGYNCNHVDAEGKNTFDKDSHKCTVCGYECKHKFGDAEIDYDSDYIKCPICDKKIPYVIYKDDKVVGLYEDLSLAFKNGKKGEMLRLYENGELMIYASTKLSTLNLGDNDLMLENKLTVDGTLTITDVSSGDGCVNCGIGSMFYGGTVNIEAGNHSNLTFSDCKVNVNGGTVTSLAVKRGELYISKKAKVTKLVCNNLDVLDLSEYDIGKTNMAYAELSQIGEMKIKDGCGIKISNNIYSADQFDGAASGENPEIAELPFADIEVTVPEKIYYGDSASLKATVKNKKSDSDVTYKWIRYDSYIMDIVTEEPIDESTGDEFYLDTDGQVFYKEVNPYMVGGDDELMLDGFVVLDGETNDTLSDIGTMTLEKNYEYVVVASCDGYSKAINFQYRVAPFEINLVLSDTEIHVGQEIPEITYTTKVSGEEVEPSRCFEKIPQIVYNVDKDTVGEYKVTFADGYKVVRGLKLVGADSLAINVVDHTWDEGVVTKEATKEEDGEMLYTCECGATKSGTYKYVEPIPPSKDGDDKDGQGDGSQDGKGDGSQDGKGDGSQDGNRPGSANDPAAIIEKKGVSFETTSGSFTILDTKSLSVEFKAAKTKSATAVTVPETVTVNGRTYQVTSIAANAFKNNKKLKKITIGKNIKKIGKNAFYGCKNLKSIKIKTTSLKTKTVGKNAFKGINKKAKFMVPKKSKKAYTKLLRKRGATKKMKIK